MNDFLKSLFKKLNISTEVSTRDKKLLLLLCSFLLIIAAYYLVFTKVDAKNEKHELEIVKLEKQVKDLEEKTKNKDKYLEDTKDYTSKTEEILSNYSSGSSKAYIINFLNTVESSTGVWIKSAAFETANPIYTFGILNSSNPASTTSYETDMVGYSNSLSIAYEADYNEWKNFISYVNSYFSKNTIDNISSSYDASSNIVSGTMTISMYYITSTDREFKESTYDFIRGKDNLFMENVDTTQSVTVSD